MGVGVFEDLARAARAVRITEEKETDTERAGRYEGLFSVYQSLYPQLKQAFADLHARCC